MDIPVYNASGKAGGTLTVSERLLGVRMNKDLLYQVATSQMANQRKVLAHTKTRSEVSGGGKKPWQQKGTGRARHGSIRSPIWVGGGVAHGPSKEVNFKRAVTKTAGRTALAIALSSRLAEGHLAVIQSLAVATGKTRDAVTALQTLTPLLKKYRAGNRILIVLAGTSDDVPTRRAFDNLSPVQVTRAADLNALTVLAFPYVIATADAVAITEKIIALPSKKQTI